jgi:hypothetical protein
MANPEREGGLGNTTDEFLDVDAPFFRFGFGDEQTVEEYLARVAPFLTTYRAYQQRRLMERQRPCQPVHAPQGAILLPHELYRGIQREPGNQASLACSTVQQAAEPQDCPSGNLFRFPHEIYGVQLPSRTRTEEPATDEPGNVAEELVVDRIGYICMVALCILSVFI